jgi:hypothetical protein
MQPSGAEAGSAHESAVVPLPYAAPYTAPPSLRAAFILALVGLGLIGLGGCFLIAVFAYHIPQVFLPGAVQSSLTAGLFIFLVVMYALAGVCLTSAGFILWKLCDRLFQLIR